MIKYLWGSKGVTCTLVFGTNYSLIDRALMKELQKSQKPWAAGGGIDLLSQELAAHETMAHRWLNVSSISTTFAQYCSNIFAFWKQPHSRATCHLRHTHWTFRGRRRWLEAVPTSYDVGPALSQRLGHRSQSYAIPRKHIRRLSIYWPWFFKLISWLHVAARPPSEMVHIGLLRSFIRFSLEDRMILSEII